jgi:hypothetical protein
MSDPYGTLALGKQERYIMFSVSDTFGRHTFTVNGSPVWWRREWTPTGWVYLFKDSLLGEWATVIADRIDVRHMYMGEF